MPGLKQLTELVFCYCKDTNCVIYKTNISPEFVPVYSRQCHYSWEVGRKGRSPELLTMIMPVCIQSRTDWQNANSRPDSRRGQGVRIFQWRFFCRAFLRLHLQPPNAPHSHFHRTERPQTDHKSLHSRTGMTERVFCLYCWFFFRDSSVTRCCSPGRPMQINFTRTQLR